MEVKHGLGYQNYEKMMRNHIFYIDKTDFIKEWWDCADEVTLITRPRRFGKTLNMSTIECFFSKQYEGRSDLFEGRKIWEDEAMRALQGTYPVIFMSFEMQKLRCELACIAIFAWIFARYWNGVNSNPLP